MTLAKFCRSRLKNDMRILMIISRHIDDPQAAGGDVQGSLYARYLAELGHDVTYLTSGSNGSTDWEGVEVRRLGKAEMLPWRAFAWYRGHASDFDAVYTEAFGGARLPFCAPLYVRQPLLTAWYQVNREVFIHQLGRVAGSVASMVESWVVRLHRNATILTPSEARRKDLISLGFDPGRVHAVPPFSIENQPDPAWDPSAREPLIVWLGKVRRYKSPHVAIEAMPQILKQAPNARLLITGRQDDEDYLKELRRTVLRLNVSASVEFSFNISEEEKQDILNRAAMLAVTSPIEGFGIAILEAATNGTPAVVSEGVPEEVVTHEYNGLRVPFGDPKALAEAVTRMLGSPELRKSLAENAVIHSRRFTKLSLQRQLGEIFNRAVDQGNLTAVGA